MNKQQKDEIRKKIIKLQDWEATPSYREAEEILFGILDPLLKEEGYSIKSTPPVRDGGLDFIAEHNETQDYQKTTIGIEYKHYQRKPVSLNVINQVIGASFTRGFNRAMVVASTRFTKQARETIKQSLPIEVELIDPDALRAWWARIEIDSSIDRLEINVIIKTVSWQFARLVAENPNILDELEWRQVEQLFAEIFEGIGFEVELTPCSKDGGKDLILECFVKGSKHTYLIEIKHWRSGVRVGQKTVREFLDVIIKEKRDGGMFLSTYGFCDTATECLSEIERQRLRLGDKKKVVALCKSYLKAEAGIWTPQQQLAEVLYEKTI